MESPNILLTLQPFLTFHFEISSLNLESVNILAIFLTLETSHCEIAPLKLLRSPSSALNKPEPELNKKDISVIFDVSIKLRSHLLSFYLIVFLIISLSSSLVVGQTV